MSSSAGSIVGGGLGYLAGSAVGAPWLGAALGSSIGGSADAARAQRKGAQAAADASLEGARIATEENRRQFDIGQQNMKPWLDVGREQGLYALRDTAKGDMSKFQMSPDYQFVRDEGLKGIERRAAARGGLQSGNTLKDLTRFNQGLASTQFGDFWNRRAGLANVGQTTAGGLGQLGAQTAGNIGNIAMGHAGNVGNAALASANARGSMYQGIGGALGQYAAYGGFRQPNPYTFDDSIGGAYGPGM